MLGYLCTDTICSDSARETVIFEKMMSNEKYPSIFPGQMQVIVFIILQVFFATRVALKIDSDIPQF